ncbi:N-anthranilate isomerase [Dichomitus squalens LYAD-421 SS1]|uniref:N-anthranilate isomerase n=1 Tax=Dichomitus squalens (strain LYAD-421) TaxID=732165 RepID=UPI000441528A|nr:N-anthranilate isomerase [Dichomitus squalens LYAD-421 SS1]EJF65202.1 N-anthranilate isomerase [Dichomitus squalens LYAD-421 SS1]
MSLTLPIELARPLDVLLIDNFDSFTWNIYQSLSLLGADVTVIRNDAIPAAAFPLLKLNSLIISPGPGHPTTDSGISREAIKFFTGKVPILGVCMGLQCLVDVFGGNIGYAGEIMHGKVSGIRHDGRGCFRDIPQGIKSTRYHSLSASTSTLPPDLAITAITSDSGVIMGVRHRKYTLEAVQYHPESILSEGGDTLFKNFLALRGGTWDLNPGFRVSDEALPAFGLEGIADKVPNGNATPGGSTSKVPTILEKIYAQRIKDVELAKQTPGTTPEDLETLLNLSIAPAPVSFLARLKAAPKKPALMAEIKRASPSKGPIAMSTNAAQQALTYALAGASVISVLTEPTWFKGTLLDMRLARQAIDSLPHRPAILRKDFIFDEYQIAEARLHGADSVLLIVAMLPVPRLHALYEYSRSLGMEPLVEVNNSREMEAALALGAKVIGVNNRNLHDFQVDMQTTTRLVDMVRERDVVLCALSGIKDVSDVRAYTQQGIGAILVGEALMRAQDTQAFIRDLLDWPQGDPKGKGHETAAPLVKICGIRTVEEAVHAAESGADMLGLMFVPKSKRYVSLERAQGISAAIRGRRSQSHRPSGAEASPIEELKNEPWFNLHARRLTDSLARDPSKRPLLVGVFQDQPLDFILQTVADVELDLVQLHGREPVEWSRHIPVPTIRVFHVDEEGHGLTGITRPGAHQFVLLDAVAMGDATGLSGGTGTRVDLELAKAVVEKGEVGLGETLPIILAGGLTPDSVPEVIRRVRPWAVDVSGGVELKDGSAKDPARVQTFISAAKAQ